MSRNINIEVRLRPDESEERMIKRFFKKCKKQEIVREYLDKVSYVMTKSQKRRQKRLKNKFFKKFERTA